MKRTGPAGVLDCPECGGRLVDLYDRQAEDSPTDAPADADAMLGAMFGGTPGGGAKRPKGRHG